MEMARNVTVKNTFIDVSDDDEEDDLPLVHALKTCPAVVNSTVFGSDKGEEADLASPQCARKDDHNLPAHVQPGLGLQAPPNLQPGLAPPPGMLVGFAGSVDDPSQPRHVVNVSLSALVEVEEKTAAPAAQVLIKPLEEREPEWSRGAYLHSTGMCKPCGWFWKPQGCASGEDCCHCHLCDVGMLRSRRKTKKIMRCLGNARRTHMI